MTDPVAQAHLLDETGYSPPVHRFPASPELASVIRLFWLPVWSLPPGELTRQRVLTYPVCQFVIGHDDAYLVGPQIDMAVEELAGSGWVLGAMLRPAAAYPLIGRPLTEAVGQRLPLSKVRLANSEAQIEEVRGDLGPDPHSRDAQVSAIGRIEGALGVLVPIDEEGELMNSIVDFVESTPEIARVTKICDKFAITERSLQRLTARRIGLTPKWLIQRRRLQAAAGRLADPDRPTLAEVAARLGYADQAHFHRDFLAATGLTPAQYAAEPRP